MSSGEPSLLATLGAGARCRCPRCGEGRLFDGYLKITDGCGVCGLDYGDVDTGDGPAVFVTSIVGFVIVMAALIVEVVYQPPYWVHAALSGCRPL